MKKTCGALAIGLLITTNAFTAEPLTIYCGKNTSNKANLLVNALKIKTRH